MNSKTFSRFQEDIEGKKQTVLFIGAGVNYTKEHKLMWPDLLDHLMKSALGRLNATDEEIKIVKQAFERDGDNVETVDSLRLKMRSNQAFSSEVKASMIKQVLGDFYIPLLKDFLYGWDVRGTLREGCKQYLAGKEMDETPFYSLFSIAEFILRHKNIKSVVTYNYDDYLSYAIDLLQNDSKFKLEDGRKIKPLDVYSGWRDEPFTENNFLIYHIHGMVQPDDKVTPHCGNQVVLSLEEYYDMARDVYSWQSATQIFHLTHYTCAFIGASLVDMTMQRVLHYANLNQSGENVYVLSASKTNGDKNDEVIEKLKNSYLELLGLKVFYDTDGYEDMYKKMNQIKTT